MDTFPLYDTLYNEIKAKNKDLTSTQKKAFIKKFQQMDVEGKELMYILIKMYSIKNNEDLYKVEINNKDYTFDINNLPILLRHMLYIFIQKHIKKIEDEIKRKL